MRAQVAGVVVAVAVVAAQSMPEQALLMQWQHKRLMQLLLVQTLNNQRNSENHRKCRRIAGEPLPSLYAACFEVHRSGHALAPGQLWQREF